MLYKKIKMAVLSLSLVFTTTLTAQKNNTVNAAMDYKNAEQAFFQQNIEEAGKNLLSAKKYIDQSAEHASTKNDPKTLMYKGKIYFLLTALAAASPDNEELKPFLNEEIAEGSLQAFRDAKANDTKNRYSKDVDDYLGMYRGMMINAGIQFFQSEDYENAYASFAGAAEFSSIIGIPDSIEAFNAGLAAERIEKYDEAAELYQRCADQGYRVPEIYILISSAQRRGGNPDKAMETIKNAQKDHPMNKDILIEMVNISLEKGDNDAAEKSLNDAIAADPENKQLYFTVGTVYDNVGKYEAAEKAYMDALKLDENYFDALYNLGALYFNKGVEIIQAAQDVLDDTEYKKMKAQADDEFEKSIPYLENAHKIDPEDKNTMLSLKQVYPRLGMTEKFNEINEKLKN